MEKIEFVDGGGHTRAALSVENGPFVVRDRAPTLYCNPDGTSYWSFDVQTRTVPEFADLSGESLEQFARDLKCEPNEVSRMLKEWMMPVLVFSD